MMRVFLTILLTALSGFACQRDAGDEASPGAEPAPGNAASLTMIEWDTWGVPHITAASDGGFFFADGWAQMHAHANTILRLYGSSRGRAAEYWGADHLQNDIMVHSLDHPGRAMLMWQQQDPELKALISSFVDGMNAYAAAHPQAIDARNRTVLPVVESDINLHAQFVVSTRFLAGRELQLSRRWSDSGSNAIAIGPERSASGNTLLLQNPHLPWFGEFLWFEKHLLGDERNIYGVHLIGMPGFGIAFNDFLGWTHTNNTIDSADLYELVLTADGYLYDGENRLFEARNIALPVRQEDGSIEVVEQTLLRSHHGPVLRMGDQQALALSITGQSSRNSLLQWWHMANARNFNEFEAALKMSQLPFWNVIYADREGNIFYLFNGEVPIRSKGDWNYWQGRVDGSDPDNDWKGVHRYDELPRLLNPDTGWLHNANDPPWTSTIPPQFNADDYPDYLSPRRMTFRPQRAARMILDDSSITFDELVAIKHDQQMALADRVLDDLLTAVESHGSALAQEAAGVLRDWDGRAAIDSRGAVLFQNWALRVQPWNPGVFAEPWDEDRPVETPDGLADPAAMAAQLDAAADEVMSKYGRLDPAWGDVNRIRHNNIDLPAGGANGILGVFRVASSRAGEDGIQTIRSGDSWVGLIEFGESPRAMVLLSYGNSSQENSPHNGDQLALFSENRLRDAWRTREQLEGRISRTEILRAAGASANHPTGE